MQITELIDSLKLEVTPRGARIMVLPLMAARRGLLIDAEENRERPHAGIVVKLGPGGVSPDSGREIPIVSQVGEVVWFGKYAGLLATAGVMRFKRHVLDPVDHFDISVYLMQESEVLMAQPGETFELEVHDGNPNKAHQKGLICELCEAAPHDLVALQALAGLTPGEVIDAEVPVELGDTAETSALIEEERKRLIAEREEQVITINGDGKVSANAPPVGTTLREG